MNDSQSYDLKDALWTPEPDSPVPYYIRKAHPNDIPFITNSWLKSYRGSKEVSGTPNNQYYFYQHKLIEALVPRSIVLVVANRADSTHILGWTCAEIADTALLLHYMYVKDAFRKQGIGSQLLHFMEEHESPPAIITTHRTHRTDRLLGSERTWFHNRYLAFENLDDGWTE